MKTSESIKNIATAMQVFHEEMNSIPKTADNPFFKSKYVPLDKILTAIKNPLKKANLTFMQFPTGENELETIILHESGEWMSSAFKMKPVKQDPQAYGSVITYQRRYALSAILGLNTDPDDDGNSASEDGFISADQVRHLTVLLSKTGKSQEEKDAAEVTFPSLKQSQYDLAVAKLQMDERSPGESENYSQKEINQMLDLK